MSALKILALAGLTSAVNAQPFELGASIGNGAYRNGSIFAPGGKADAGIRNRFAAGDVLGDDMYEDISGELRYLYQSIPLHFRRQKEIYSARKAITCNKLVHPQRREDRMRPFLAAGAEIKRLCGRRATAVASADIGNRNPGGQRRVGICHGPRRRREAAPPDARDPALATSWII